MLLATLWLAFIVATPAWVAWCATGGLMIVTYGMLAWVGSARLQVREGTLYAGPAHIDLSLLGAAEPLDPAATRRVHGVEADARAFLLTRPYLKGSVRVPLHDPADPTPYWLLSSRHPQELAAAIGASAGPEGDRRPQD